ncbi:galaxin [Nematostella vectensis]|uniref:galaxin n=1 Tax=Nematostella vectensis TaxID=45351 RepID=UPI0020777560|nr:galaxin [Nematostella vectensis]
MACIRVENVALVVLLLCLANSQALLNGQSQKTSRSNDLDPREPCGGLPRSSPDICCEGRRLKRTGGLWYSFCCGNTTYDGRTQLCCDGNVRDKMNGRWNSYCCGSQTFDRRTHQCCHGKVLRKKGRPGNSFCCGGVTSNCLSNLHLLPWVHAKASQRNGRGSEHVLLWLAGL